MKKFETPVLEVVESFTMEPVYAISGKPDTPHEHEDPKGDWKIWTEWRNHNSGSHSELAIIGVHSGSHSGNTLTMDFCCCDFKLDYVKDNSGYAVSNVSETGFTITRNNFFNPTERFEFNIQLVAKDSQYHGAIGQTNCPCPARVICVSYTES